MGYTRYWERTSEPLTEDFLEAVREILEDCDKRGIIVRDGWGENIPKVTLEEVAINGNAETELDHETFYLDNEPSDFEFCKTARKPYDYAVRKILKVAKEMGLVTNVSSDGPNRRIISDSQYLRGEV